MSRWGWHTNPFGQTIQVTEGVGLCQREGGPIDEIRPDDTVYFEPNENHWHGAAPNRLMATSPCRRPTIRAAQSLGAIT